MNLSLVYPLYAVAFAAKVYEILNKGFVVPASTFAWHTTLNFAAFGFLFPIGLWVQKQRQFGYSRVWLHWFFMLVGVTSLYGGAYFIYATKEAYGKAHLASWHSYLGVAVTVLLTLQMAVSGMGPLAPWSDGKTKASESDRENHAKFGGLAYLLGVVTCFFGWFTTTGNKDDIYSQNNMIFAGGFLVTMLFMGIATAHSKSYKAAKLAKANAAAKTK